MSLTFLNGAKVKIIDSSGKKFHIKFYDHATNNLIYETSITGGMWASPSKQYFIKWRIEIFNEEGNKIEEHIYNCSDKKVYVHLASKALGDTIAWFPYVEEFRKQHNCKIICSTFHNDWFESTYPEIEFISPGTKVVGLYAMYEIGWFFKEGKPNFSRNKYDPKSIPLQKTASDILGIPYKEISPKLHVEPQPPLLQEPYVVIAPHGSKHASYWNHPKGWQTVIDW